MQSGNILIYNELGSINDGDISDLPYSTGATSGTSGGTGTGVDDFNDDTATNDTTADLQPRPLGTGFVITKLAADAAWSKLLLQLLCALAVYTWLCVAMHKDARVVLYRERPSERERRPNR
jgi:hypothetical protein